MKYNEAAAIVMKKHDVPTHDLFTMSKKRMEELMLPANVHYKKKAPSRSARMCRASF